jgi:hypothetical protein
VFQDRGRRVPIERDRIKRASRLAIFDGDGQTIVVFEARLVDDVSISTALQDLDARVLPGIRQPIVKLKLLPLDG